MTQDALNPFDGVKATDLRDEQIEEYFVDFPSGASLVQRIKPAAAMPMIILGGKGSGKTHLMRYISSALQFRRHGTGPRGIRGVARDGYLGIYLRCGGLNAERFHGKGQPAEAWRDVFAYYNDLWLGQAFLSAVDKLFGSDLGENDAIEEFVRRAVKLFDVPVSKRPRSIAQLSKCLATLQRDTDFAINNSSLTRRLDVQLRLSRGSLIFGLPRALAEVASDLANVRFVYLLDEFENLTEPQQQYFNTLLRERQEPCGFKIGVRLYGMLTYRTLGAEEENREDAEFEALRLDRELRDRTAAARAKFATDLVRRRLLEAGYVTDGSGDLKLPEQFVTADDDRFLRKETDAYRKRHGDKISPYLVTLRKKLCGAKGVSGSVPPVSEAAADGIVQRLRFTPSLLVERTSVFLFYREWSKQCDLVASAELIGRDAQNFFDGASGTPHERVLTHYRADIIAQLLRDTNQRQRYLGFDTFVTMSGGLPRCLLTILKHVFTWSRFYGEEPFRRGLISSQAQMHGVREAADWFFDEARAPGVQGVRVRRGMSQLGQLLRDLRFSDKPSECSLCAFSADLGRVSGAAQMVLAEAENWSMLIGIPRGQRDRNDARVDAKFQVHPMLAPRWDLPIGRRGALALRGPEVDATFAPVRAEDFEKVVESRVSRMRAPSFGRRRSMAQERQQLLPGLDDE